MEISSKHLQELLRQRQLVTLDSSGYVDSFKQQIYSPSSFVRRFKVDKQLHGHEGCVNCINFSFDGRLLASGSDDLHIILWDWMKGDSTIINKFDSGHMSNVFQAKFMPQTNDSILVSAARDGQVRRHVLSTTGTLVTSNRVAYHNDSAHKLAIEPDNPHVFLSCGEDGTVLQVDLRCDEIQRNKILVCRNTKNARIPLYSIFIDPSNYSHFAVSGRDQYARIYDRRTLASDGIASTPLKLYCPDHLESPGREIRKANITCLVYSYDGKELLCSYNDEDIYTFNTTHSSGSQFVQRFEGHRNNATVKGVNYFGLQSEYIVSGSDCGHVFLWDKKTADIIQYLVGDKEGVVNCLEPHPHIPVLAVSGLDHNIKIITPSANDITDLEGLDEVTSNNLEKRQESIDGGDERYEMLLDFIMRHYTRRLRRRQGGQEDNDSTSSFTASDEDEDIATIDENNSEPIRWRHPPTGRDSDDENDNSDSEPHVLNCIQS